MTTARDTPTTERAIDWRCEAFAALDGGTLYALLALRQRVFVVEQRCAFLDADGRDLRCHHVLGERGGVLVAAARIAPPGECFREASIGRVVTAPEVRGTGGGRALMLEALRHCERVYGGVPVRIGAQAHLEAFYASLGFVCASAPYDEDGIVHVEMVR